jgi:two-component system, OmpR family, KDP operon response regulator KdpE
MIAEPGVAILHVEDEAVNRALLRAVLGRSDNPRIRDADLVEAETIADAKRILSARAMDLILLDVRLPDGDGLDLLRLVRSSNPDLGVVVMSASVLPEEREEALRAGCNAFVPKPYLASELLLIIGRVLTPTGA